MYDRSVILRQDETWHRLREWTSGQTPSERLAAQLLAEEGYSEIDPSHPLGGLMVDEMVSASMARRNPSLPFTFHGASRHSQLLSRSSNLILSPLLNTPQTG